MQPSADFTTWKNIQYNVQMKSEPAVQVERIKKEMERKGLKPGEIAEQSGVSYATLYKILNIDHPRTSAEMIAKLAVYFGCSMEYLMGLTDERAPRTLALNTLVESLVDVARRLPASRQRDLLLMAKTYAETEDERLSYVLAEGIEIMLRNLGQDEVEELERDRIVAILQKMERGHNAGPDAAARGFLADD